MEHQLILDRYRPLEELGEGGFGVVVLAWDTRMQRRVAIKRLPLPADSRNASQLTPGLTEARTASMLNHPAIVTVFDFDTDDDEAFLVMEHVDGTSLDRVLDDVGGPLTIDEAASVLKAVFSAVEFAHDNGVLHLDIKPENVLINRDGRVKVTDFGMAELSSVAGHGPAWGGTPGYMPLEQIEGGRVTERTDEWALGVLAYEVLTGENPFDAETPESAVIRLETVEPGLPSDLSDDLDLDVDDALLPALSLRATDRYGDVRDFADALLPLLGDAAAGRESLRELVEEYATEQELGEDARPAGVGLWDLLGGPMGSLLLRAVAAAESGWLAWAGLAPFGLQPGAALAAVGLVALAGALAPSLGVGLGLGCFVAGLFAAKAWVVASAVLVLGGAWWWLLGRRSMGAAVLPLAGPVLGILRIPFAQPLLAGFSLRPLPAAVTALFGGALTMLASAASAQGAPYLSVYAPYAADVWNVDLALASIRALVTSPAALVALAGWPVAAGLMSVACTRATRGAALVGMVLGGGSLAGAYLLADEVARLLGEPLSYGTVATWVALGGSLILVGVVVALGAPLRPEEE